MFNKYIKYALLGVVSIGLTSCGVQEPKQPSQIVCNSYSNANIKMADFKQVSMDDQNLSAILKIALNNICIKAGDSLQVKDGLIKDLDSQDARYNISLDVKIEQSQDKESGFIKDSSKDTLNVISKARLVNLKAEDKSEYSSTQRTTFIKSTRKIVDIGEDSDIDKKELEELLANTIAKSIQNTLDSAAASKN